MVYGRTTARDKDGRSSEDDVAAPYVRIHENKEIGMNLYL